MKRERILPCVNHPKAFWPWDKPYVINRHHHGLKVFVPEVYCPMCAEDKRARIREQAGARVNKSIRAWNTHAYGSDEA